MQRNGLADVYRAGRFAARVDRQTAGDVAAPAVESGSATLAGTYETATGNLKPAGITGVTSTGDPFYSAGSS